MQSLVHCLRRCVARVRMLVIPISLGGCMRQLLTLAALAACAALLASCGDPPEPVAFDQVCNQADGKLVQTAGYFVADSSVFCSNIGSNDLRCGLGFAAAP